MSRRRLLVSSLILVLVAAVQGLFALPVSAAQSAGSRDATFAPPTFNSGVDSVTELTFGANAGKYLIGGNFSNLGGNSATDHVARLNPDGSRDTSFTPLTLGGAVESVTELTRGANAGKYLIAGWFTDAGGNARTDHVARLNPDGSRDATFTPPVLNDAVYSATELTRGANAGKYLIAGWFTNAGGNAATDHLARLKVDGSRDPSFTPPTLNSIVDSVTELTRGANAGKYLIGGGFTNAGGHAGTDYLARLKANGSRDGTFAPPALNRDVFSATELTSGANAGKYLIGGDFSNLGGSAATDWLARLKVDGSRDASFTPTALNDSVHSVTELTRGANAGKYLIGGGFTNAGGIAGTGYVARLKADGSRDASFTPPALNRDVFSVAELTYRGNAGKYLIGGWFTNAGGSARKDSLARLMGRRT